VNIKFINDSLREFGVRSGRNDRIVPALMHFLYRLLRSL
jgi:hypothetical protein